MTEIIESAGKVMTFLTGAVGDIAETVISNPLLLISFGVGFVFLGVKFLRNLMRSA